MNEGAAAGDRVSATRDGEPASTAILVDYDNIMPRREINEDRLSLGLDRMTALALRQAPETQHVSIRMYGGWLDDGMLTNQASELLSVLGQLSPFPIAHPKRDGLLRGDVSLVRRLWRLPAYEWGHTLRHRSGVPRVRLAQRPYPESCAHQSDACPVKRFHRFAKDRWRLCSATDCPVTNAMAFRAPEQKMVDVMLACDSVAFADAGWHVLVMSSDLDVVPAVALSASGSPGRVALARADESAADLYGAELSELGVAVESWEEL